jgi:hypothetical protein
MPAPSFAVNKINVSHQATPDGKGGFVNQKRLTYYVGEHGPFTHTYTPPDGDANKMKSDIQAQVQELQSLHEVTG